MASGCLQCEPTCLKIRVDELTTYSSICICWKESAGVQASDARRYEHSPTAFCGLLVFTVR